MVAPEDYNNLWTCGRLLSFDITTVQLLQ